jgi:hypothetical protein
MLVISISGSSHLPIPTKLSNYYDFSAEVNIIKAAAMLSPKKHIKIDALPPHKTTSKTKMLQCSPCAIALTPKQYHHDSTTTAKQPYIAALLPKATKTYSYAANLLNTKHMFR